MRADIFSNLLVIANTIGVVRFGNSVHKLQINSSRLNRLHLSNNHYNSNMLDIYHFDEVTSTMDKAKELIKEFSQPKDCFGVVAKAQTMGRGTKGIELNLYTHKT